MTTSATSRRKILSLGLTCCGAGLVPSMATEAGSTDDPLAALGRKLLPYSQWVRVRPAQSPSAPAVLDCGVSDFSLWAGRCGRIAGQGVKIRANGNHLEFAWQGRPVTVCLHAV